MALLNVDTDKCVTCSICSMACPLGLIVMEEESPVPAERKNAQEKCIKCGHCVAACPNDALAVSTMNCTDFVDMDKELAVSVPQMEQALKSRRSVRNFRKKEVDRETLSRLVDISRWAASGHNKQASGWTVVENRAAVAQVVDHTVDWMKHVRVEHPERARELFLAGIIRAWSKGKDLVANDAPHLVVVHGPKDGITPFEDAIAAITYAEVMAPTMNLGACWAGFITMAAKGWAPLASYLKVPEGNEVYGVLMLGTPRFKYHKIPTRHEREVMFVQK